MKNNVKFQEEESLEDEYDSCDFDLAEEADFDDI